MSSAQDFSIGWKPETTFKTGVTVDRFPEVLGSTLDFNPQVKQGQGIRPGSRVDRSGRYTVPVADGGGDTPLELLSKGLGTLLQACFGAGAATLVSGSTYQHLFTLGDTPPSMTIQEGVPEDSGTIDAITFLGCMVTQFELNFPNGDIATIKPTWDVADISTAPSYATPSGVSNPANLFQFGGGAIANGTLTSPTTTALASGSTPLAGIRDATVMVNRNMRTDRFNFNNSGRKDKQLPGKTDITGQITAEYRSTTFRDMVLAGTPMPLIITMSAGALSTGLETFQLVLPEVRFQGELPKSNGTDLITVPLKFTALDNLTAAQPIWAVMRTADPAL